ncbi:hypothetical protein PAMP_022303 [Pampus punctatissimus]
MKRTTDDNPLRAFTLTPLFCCWNQSDGLRNPLQREQLSRSFMKTHFRLLSHRCCIAQRIWPAEVELNCRAAHQSPTLCESARCPVVIFKLTPRRMTWSGVTSVLVIECSLLEKDLRSLRRSSTVRENHIYMWISSAILPVNGRGQRQQSALCFPNWATGHRLDASQTT